GSVRLRQQTLPFVLERGLERPARPRQERLDRLVRYAHRLAHLDLAHALVVEERERQPLSLRQRLQRRIHPPSQLPLHQRRHLARRLYLLGQRLPQAGVALRAHPIDAQVGRDPPQPRTYPPFAQLQPGGVAPQPQQRLLRHILGLGV